MVRKAAVLTRCFCMLPRCRCSLFPQCMRWRCSLLSHEGKPSLIKPQWGCIECFAGTNHVEVLMELENHRTTCNKLIWVGHYLWMTWWETRPDWRTIRDTITYFSEQYCILRDHLGSFISHNTPRHCEFITTQLSHPHAHARLPLMKCSYFSFQEAHLMRAQHGITCV